MAQEFDIHAEVKALKKDVLDFRSYFDDIYNTLDRLDRESTIMRLRSWIGATPAGAWDVIRKEYNRLLRESRRLATTVAAGAEDFRTDMIPFLQDTAATFEEKKHKVTKFIADTKETDRDAERISQGFVGICLGIRIFQTSYSSQVKSSKRQIDNGMYRLNQEINDLIDSLDHSKVESRLAYFLTELREDIPVERGDILGDRIIEAIGKSLCDGEEREVSGGMTITTAMGAQEKLARAKEMLNEKEKALKKLEDDSANLEHLVPPRIKAAESHTDYICGRLGAIGKIWAVVRTDAQTLHSQLNKAHSASGEKEFRRMIVERTRIIPLYDNLEKILYSYSNAVTE